MCKNGTTSYSDDANGNMVSAASGEDQIQYAYTPYNMLKSVNYSDETYLQYGYDAFGRKVYREEAYWKLEKQVQNPLKLSVDITRYMVICETCYTT